MNIIFLGAPGSGKGTQSELISKQYNLIPLVAGDILRDEKKSKSELGRRISSIMDKGDLLPDSMIDTIIENQLETYAISIVKTGFIFDGYPRTIGQGKFLDGVMDKYESNIDLVLFLDVDEDELIKRLLERGKTSNRDDDKDESIIKKRMLNYHKSTNPLKEFYKDKIVIIDGMRTIEEINEEIREVITRENMRKIINGQ